MQLGNNIHVCFVGFMMAKSFKRSLQDDMKEDSSAQNEHVLLILMTANMKRSFSICMKLKDQKSGLTKSMRSEEEELQSQQLQFIEWTESANLYQII